MAYCNGCGKTLEDGWQSCPFCGRTVGATIQSAPVSAPPANIPGASDSVVLPGTPEQAMQRVAIAVSNMKNVSATMTGPNTLTVSERSIPTWAGILAVIGLFFFLLGLLFLLVRETRTVGTVVFQQVEGGTRVQMSGQVNSQGMLAIRRTLGMNPTFIPMTRHQVKRTSARRKS